MLYNYIAVFGLNGGVEIVDGDKSIDTDKVVNIVVEKYLDISFIIKQIKQRHTNLQIMEKGTLTITGTSINLQPYQLHSDVKYINRLILGLCNTVVVTRKDCCVITSISRMSNAEKYAVSHLPALLDNL